MDRRKEERKFNSREEHLNVLVFDQISSQFLVVLLSSHKTRSEGGGGREEENEEERNRIREREGEKKMREGW